MVMEINGISFLSMPFMELTFMAAHIKPLCWCKHILSVRASRLFEFMRSSPHFLFLFPAVRSTLCPSLSHFNDSYLNSHLFSCFFATMRENQGFVTLGLNSAGFGVDLGGQISHFRSSTERFSFSSLLLLFLFGSNRNGRDYQVVAI